MIIKQKPLTLNGKIQDIIFDAKGIYNHINKTVLFFTMVSITIVFIIDFWLINIEECWQYGYEFGKIFRDICFSFITGFFFYLIVVVLKEYKDKDKLRSVWREYHTRICEEESNYKNILRRFSKRNSKGDADWTLENITEICDVYRTHLSNNRESKITWIDFSIKHRYNTLRYIEGFRKSIIYPEAELISILAEIETCDLFYLLGNNHNSNFSIILTYLPNEGDLILSYFAAVEKLNNYMRKGKN